MSGMKFLKELSIPSRLCTLVTIVGWLSLVIALAFNGASLYDLSPPPISIPAKMTVVPTCSFLFESFMLSYLQCSRRALNFVINLSMVFAPIITLSTSIFASLPSSRNIAMLTNFMCMYHCASM